MPKSTSIRLDLRAAAGLKMFPRNRRATAVIGGDATYVVNADFLGGYTNETTFSIGGIPEGTPYSFLPATLSADGDTAATIDTTNLSAGTYYMNIEGGTSPLPFDAYWVSPTGAATWANARSSSPLSGTACCTLATANTNASAGDTVYMRAGTYTTHLFPSNSGTAEARITYQAYADEVPVIRNTSTSYATYYHGFFLRERSYITIDGINVNNPVGDVPGGKDRPLMITHGGSYNILRDCDIDGNTSGTVQVWDGLIDGGTPCVHNWFIGCTIHSTGMLGAVGTGVDDWGGMQVGVPAYDNHSNHQTFEDCTFYSGGHHNLETFTHYNVIKNCYFHHEGSMPNNTGNTPTYGPDQSPPAASANLWGNRHLSIYDGHNVDGTFNLLEGNRHGFCGPPPDDDGGDAIALTSPKNILRFNHIYKSLNNGLLLKMGGSSSSNNNRIYNNTIYASGRFRNTGPQWQGHNIRLYPSTIVASGNVVINNLLNTYGGSSDISAIGDNTYINNFLTADGNPNFVDTTATDPFDATKPDLSLETGSPCLAAGLHLTLANGSGSGSTTLVVDDALFFQDGTWGSSLSHGVTHFPDWIAIGTVGNVVEIQSINYATNTITLKTAKTWSDDASIWLYKNSDGDVVLNGAAPNIGAYSGTGE